MFAVMSVDRRYCVIGTPLGLKWSDPVGRRFLKEILPVVNKKVHSLVTHAGPLRPES